MNLRVLGCHLGPIVAPGTRIRTRELLGRIDGLEEPVNPGAEVQGQYGGGTAVELFTLGSIDQVWVLADVNEQDIGQVATGRRAQVQINAYPEKRFEGVVTYIYPTLKTETRTVEVSISEATARSTSERAFSKAVFIGVRPSLLPACSPSGISTL